MKRLAALAVFFLFLAPLVGAQGFAVSYPPNLTHIEANNTYEFTVTVINSLDSSIYVRMEAYGHNVRIYPDGPGWAYIDPHSSREIKIILEMPENTTHREFDGYIRVMASPSGPGGKIAGSVTIPVKGLWVNAVSGHAASGETGDGEVTTMSSNENLTPETRGSTLQNTTENTTEDDLISALIEKYSSQNAENVGIEASGLEVKNETNSTVGLEKEPPASPTFTPVTLETTTSGGSNVLLYFIGAVIIGVALSKYVRRENGDEEGPADDYYYGHGY